MQEQKLDLIQHDDRLFPEVSHEYATAAESLISIDAETDVANVKTCGKRFIITGGFQAVRKTLINRGWIEESDETSLDFDLKWTLRTSEIDFGRLRPHQVVNHFQKNRNLTTKVISFRIK